MLTNEKNKQGNIQAGDKLRVAKVIALLVIIAQSDYL